MNFSNRDAAAIGIQILGLNLILRYFQYIGMAFTRQMPITAVSWATTTFGMLLLGIGLLFSARQLAIFIVRRKRCLRAIAPKLKVDVGWSMASETKLLSYTCNLRIMCITRRSIR